MEKIDPYDNKGRYLKWKEKAVTHLSGLSQENRDIFLKYLNDMERGVNVASNHKKGSRSYHRLNSIKVRILFVLKTIELKANIKDITQVTEDELNNFFLDMRNGRITKQDGTIFKSVKDYVQDFKAFWHWWMKINKKQGKDLIDITLDLDTSGEKPKWVYMTEDEIKTLAENARFDYKVMIWFLYDTGIRAPTEMSNVRVSDFFNDFKELNIRHETSKTFGRRIKLMLCTHLIKDYVKAHNLSNNDFLFTITPAAANKYLKRLALRLLGEKESPAGEKYSNITMYDFRHCSCCYWLPRYKSESALKYRFGWKESDKIHYYSELLGMRDTICQDDLLVDLTTLNHNTSLLIKIV